MDMLINVEPQTDLTRLALKDGIVTVHEYTAWLLGYKTAQDIAINMMNELRRIK